MSNRMWLVLSVLIISALACGLPSIEVLPETGQEQQVTAVPQPTADPGGVATQQAIPTIPAGNGEAAQGLSEDEVAALANGDLSGLYERVNPGVVNIQTIIGGGGQTSTGAGSGFILSEDGLIVTNNHVVQGADQVFVTFYNAHQVTAEVIGTDRDSDLAVIRASEMAEGAHPLPVADSDSVRVGQRVIAIGNPFGLGSSMSTGIVSAIGRTIDTGVTPFSIPQAIQTDAALNPGNSGGPLLNVNGEVIGVNAVIATSGSVAANVGVGFAISSNVVRLVAPVLIEQGAYQWPWLGVEGSAVSQGMMEANNLASQQGAYIVSVRPGGPADQAGLRGATGLSPVNGVDVPVGGDVIVAVNGERVINFNDLLVEIAFRSPGDQMDLTVLRDGQEQQVTVTLGPRPRELGPGEMP